MPPVSRVLILLVACLLTVLPARAQSVQDHISTGPAPDWLGEITANWTEFEMGQGEAIEYLMADVALQAASEPRHYYNRLAMRLNTAEAIENNATVTVDFDPAYQKITFHQITIHRGDTRIDALSLEDFDLFRMETDRDRLIYNGDLQAAFIVPGLRVGDILDYAYSVTGANPATAPNFQFFIDHEYAVPVRYLRSQVITEVAAGIALKAYAGAPEPQVTTTGNETRYAWEAENVPPKLTEEDTPKGHFSFASHMISSYASWSEVGRHFAPYYDANALPPDLEQTVAHIRADHADPKDQLRAALAFVQSEVRYLGIELGAGGYIPRPAAQTLARRFGDCKDMVVLLNTLLTALGIEANPLLVDITWRGSIETLLPSHGAFDHVITMATIDGTSYFLDPTRGEQLGSLDTLQQGDFGRGVIISDNSPGMIAVAPQSALFDIEIKDTYFLDDEDETGRIPFVNIVDYYRSDADNMAGWVRRNSPDVVDRNILGYYEDHFDDIALDGPVTVEIFEDEARLRLTSRFTLGNMWSPHDDAPGVEWLQTFPYDLVNAAPDFEGGNRTEPYALNHPRRLKHSINFATTRALTIYPEDLRRLHPALDYHIVTNQSVAGVTRTFVYKTKSDRIEAADFAATMDTIREINRTHGLYAESAGTGLLASALTFLGTASEEQITGIIMAYLFAAALIAAIGAYFLSGSDEDRRREAHFYPVSLPKFLILQTVTLGIYLMYWSFKNWRWVAETTSDTVHPRIYAFFNGLSNFGLYNRMARIEGRGLGWFNTLAPLFATIVLIAAVLDRYTSRADVVETGILITSFLLTILAPVPAALQTLKLNEDRPDIIQRNSRFNWPVLALILLFAPLCALAVIGIFLP